MAIGRSRAVATAIGRPIAKDKEEHQKAFVTLGGVGPLVKLLKMGSAKVQEEAASTLASINADVSHQREIVAAGCIPPLVAIRALQPGGKRADALSTVRVAHRTPHE